MPDWLNQSAGLGWRLLVVVAFGAVVVAGAAVLGTVVASVVLAVAVTAAFDPLAARLRAGGRTPTAAAAIVTLAAAGIAVAAIAVVVIAFVPGIARLLQEVQAGLAAVEDALESGAIGPPASTIVTETVEGVTAWLQAAAAGAIASIASSATILLLAVFLLFFLVTDADRAIAWLLQATDASQRAMIAEGAVSARARMGRSLRETVLRAAVLGGVTLAVAVVLGLPAPLALAVLVFAGGLVPLLGLVAATAAVGLVALGASGAPAALIVVVVLALTTVFLPRLLGPDRWHGHEVHPGVVLVALAVGALVAGLLGLVLAVPVVIVLLEIAPELVAALNGGSGRAAAATGIVPPWLDRLAQWSWRLLVLVAVAAVAVYVLFLVPLLVVPFVFAAVAAATLAPGVGVLRRRGATPTTASLGLTVGGFGLIVLILGVTVATLAEPLKDIVANARAGAGSIDDLAGSTDAAVALVEAVVPSIIQALGVVVAGLAGLAVGIVLGSILTFYLLRDGPEGFEVLARPLAAWRRDELRAAASRTVGVVGGYMIGTGAISAFGAATQFLILWILDIPLAWPLAVLAFFGGFIPYIGSLLTTGLAFLVTVATGSTQDIMIMAIYTLVFNIVQGNIVAPLVYGRAVSIHPAVVLLAIPAGSAVAGMAGMFLAVPVIGVVATTWRTVLRVFGRQPSDREGAADDAAADEPAQGPGAPVQVAAEAPGAAGPA